MSEPADSQFPVSPAIASPSRLVSPWWRASAIGAAVLLLLALATALSMYEQFRAQIGHLQTQLLQAPQIRWLAVLTDAQHQPALLVTFVPQEQALRLQRLNSVTEGSEDSMQLWALDAEGKPHDLGVLESRGKTLLLPATEADLARSVGLAISVEDRGGVPQQRGPRLPYLFQGALVQRAL